MPFDSSAAVKHAQADTVVANPIDHVPNDAPKYAAPLASV